MHDKDCLRRFVFDQFPIRGHLVHLDASWLALLEHREYPPSIRDTLGEALASSVLLAATIKFEGVLSLQLQGDGPVSLLLAQCSHSLGVRGVVRYREAAETLHLGELAGNGNLTVTLESDDGKQRYQGIVPLSGARLSNCLQGYFENSEQLPTRLWLHADDKGAYGMLLQRLPDTSDHDVDDAWRRVQLIGDTLTAVELASLQDGELLRRLFNEDDVRVFEPAPVFFRCRCSRERVTGMLRALGEAESRSVVEQQGKVEVRCDFCNRAYLFDPIDIEQLFKTDVASDVGPSMH